MLQFKKVLKTKLVSNHRAYVRMENKMIKNAT